MVSYIVPPGSPVSTSKGTVSDGKHELHPPELPIPKVCSSVLPASFPGYVLLCVSYVPAAHCGLDHSDAKMGKTQSMDRTSGHASVTCCHRRSRAQEHEAGVGLGWGRQGQPGWRGAEVLPPGPISELTLPLPSEIPHQSHSLLSTPLCHRVLRAPAWQPRTHWSSPFWLVSPVCPFFKTPLSTSHSPG